MQFTGDDFFADKDVCSIERFVGAFAHELEHSGGYRPDDAIAMAKTLLPEILSYDPRRPASFPQNGRTLTDDVFDVFCAIYTNGQVTGDKVGAHGDLLDDFPYLGPAAARTACHAGDDPIAPASAR